MSLNFSFTGVDQPGSATLAIPSSPFTGLESTSSPTTIGFLKSSSPDNIKNTTIITMTQNHHFLKKFKHNSLL